MGEGLGQGDDDSVITEISRRLSEADLNNVRAGLNGTGFLLSSAFTRRS